MDSQEKLLADLATVDMADISLNVHLEVPPLQAMEPDPEDPLAEAWTLQELSPNAAGEGQSFLDPGKARVLFLFLDFYFESSGAVQGWGWLETPNTG